jgi:membrane protein required for colicin V production
LKVLDIILVILLLIGAFQGYRKGLLLEIFGLIALVLAVIGGLKLMHWGIEFMQERFDISSNLLPIIAFIVIFIAIILLVSLIGRLLKNVVHLTLLGSVDKLAGSILGILKWAFGLSILLWFFSSIGYSFPEEMSFNTYVYPEIYAFAPTVIGYFSSIFPFAGEILKIIAGYFN